MSSEEPRENYCYRFMNQCIQKRRSSSGSSFVREAKTDKTLVAAKRTGGAVETSFFERANS